MLHWYKDKVNEAFADVGTDVIDAFGVNDLLPLNEQKTDGQKKPKDSGIKNNFEEFKLSRKNNPAQNFEGNKADDLLAQVLDTVGLGDDSNEEDGTGYGDDSGGSSGGGNSSAGGNGGQGGQGYSERNDNDVTVKKEQRVASTNAVQLKIIELNAAEGSYRIVGKALKKSKAIEIELKSIGANGLTYPLKIVGISSPTNDIFNKQNAVRLDNLPKNSKFKADITIDSKLRLKMEGTIYEIKG